MAMQFELTKEQREWQMKAREFAKKDSLRS